MEPVPLKQYQAEPDRTRLDHIRLVEGTVVQYRSDLTITGNKIKLIQSYSET